MNLLKNGGLCQMELAQAITKLDALQRKMFAYNHAMGVLYYDGATAAPAGSAANRADWNSTPP